MAMETQAKKWDVAQVPIEQRWREAGYTEEQIRDMRSMQMAELASGTDTLAKALLEQERQFSQEGGAE